MAHLLVLGGGVVGVSVAIGARLAGHEVAIAGELFLGDSEAWRTPLFASAFPAASAFPHTVDGEDIAGLMADSNAVFALLSGREQAGVSLRRHYELFEHRMEAPDHLRAFPKFRTLDGDAPIRRPGADQVHGHEFNYYMCDFPRYAPWLAGFARSCGVRFERRSVTREWLDKQRVGLMVNCLGAGACRVYDDIGPGVLYRGILLVAPALGKGCVRPQSSYNYTPDFDAYPGFGGKPADVYFYPRAQDCILGGTRQPGRIDTKSGEFVPFEPHRAEMVEVAGMEVPRAVLDLNTQLIGQMTGQTLGDGLRALVGYRHMDGSAEHPRLQIGLRERRGLPPHIDCFGFGGAGVALSWGAATRVLSLIVQIAGNGLSEAALPEALSGQLRLLDR